VQHAWDRRLAARALAFGGLAALLTLLVQLTTDGATSWPRRLAMWAALAPVAGAIGVLAAARIARAHGELRALEALGVHPMAALRGAIAGGVALALAGAALIGNRSTDLGALFRRPAAPRSWVADAAGGMRELTLGVRLAPGGVLEPLERLAEPSAPAGPPRALLVVVLVLFALAAPTWMAAPRSLIRRAVVGLLALTVGIVAFVVVAAGHVGVAALALAPTLLGLDLVLGQARARGR
jgi:hypothetical protein